MHGYFDYNATSLLRPEAASALGEWAHHGGGNPSSMHRRGRQARAVLEEARRAVADLAGTAARQVVFTSGATESNNTVMRAVAATSPRRRVVLSGLEHHSIVATADDLQRTGVDVTRLGVEPSGDVDLAQLAKVTNESPCLLTFGWANGETGHVSDVASVVSACAPETLVLLDAAQAAGRIPVALGERVDALTMSAHKFGAPPGIGALVVSQRLRAQLRPLLTGGPQEWGLRAGTPNVPGAAAMGAAARASMSNMENEALRLRDLRERLWSLLHAGSDALLRITPPGGLPNTLTLAVADASSDSLIAALDLDGFCVSAGSACAAGSPEPSHVVAALGIEPRYSRGILRISMGWATECAAVERLATSLLGAIGRAKAAAPA